MSNHTHYAQRLDFINTILNAYNLSPKSISPIVYDKDCPFPYNNFIYLVSLSQPTTSTTLSQNGSTQPGTSPIPPGTEALVLRLSNSNPATGLNSMNRVENEVAAIFVARQSAALRRVVPEVYAWASAKDQKQGWVMMQYVSGEALDEVFNSM